MVPFDTMRASLPLWQRLQFIQSHVPCHLSSAPEIFTESSSNQTWLPFTGTYGWGVGGGGGGGGAVVMCYLSPPQAAAVRCLISHHSRGLPHLAGSLLTSQTCAAPSSDNQLQASMHSDVRHFIGSLAAQNILGHDKAAHEAKDQAVTKATDAQCRAEVQNFAIRPIMNDSAWLRALLSKAWPAAVETGCAEAIPSFAPLEDRPQRECQPDDEEWKQDGKAHHGVAHHWKDLGRMVP